MAETKQPDHPARRVLVSAEDTPDGPSLVLHVPEAWVRRLLELLEPAVRAEVADREDRDGGPLYTRRERAQRVADAHSMVSRVAAGMTELHAKLRAEGEALEALAAAESGQCGDPACIACYPTVPGVH